jgi:hypothetical protein
MHHPHTRASLLALLFCIISMGLLHAQNVGIGTAAPLDKLHVNGNVRVNPLAGVGNRLVASDPVGTLINVAAGTNGQVLTQTAAGPAWQTGGAGANINSVSLGTDYTVTTAAFTNVTGMSLTFTATKTSVLMLFSASGFAYTNSMAYVQFRIMNGATAVGGTQTLTQNYDDVTGTITPWSCTFSRMLTGLTIGNSYTLQVQALRNGILGTYDTVIQAATTPNGHHMTLSTIQ